MAFRVRDSLIRVAYRVTLGRDPTDYEMGEAHYLVGVRGARACLLHLCAKPQEETAQGADMRPLFVPPDHYYSPIVDPASLFQSGFFVDRDTKYVEGVKVEAGEILKTFQILSEHFPNINFPETAQASHRYFYQNSFFSYGDAIIFAAMLRHFKPASVVEIGSGFSSAVLLDTLDSAGLNLTQCTFIEPYPDRLRGLLRPTDAGRVKIIETGVQLVDRDVFTRLNAGDILFIDSTHVSKTGSDVNHEIFEVLPSLQSGVIIHFHDIFWPFEYPDYWIMSENRSWNELYILRAFLTHNDRYEILYFSDFVHRMFSSQVLSTQPLISRNAGGGLWLRKT
jgi:hypothetical protein